VTEEVVAQIEQLVVEEQELKAKRIGLVFGSQTPY
jgi:hypothetical protein